MEFSKLSPAILNPTGRIRVAKQILTVLQDHEPNIKNKTVLDIGCSSGIITDYLAPYFKSIIGIDVDSHVLPKKENFLKMSGDNLKFKDQTFDIVICNQVYYWFEDPTKLLSEIYRVLKPGGVCFFANVNKLALYEPQYRLFFLTWLPKYVASLYVQLTKRAASYDCHYLSYWELEKLCHKFKIIHYTPLILKNPLKFNFTRLYKIPKLLRNLLPEQLSSNIIWLLQK